MWLSRAVLDCSQTQAYTSQAWSNGTACSVQGPDQPTRADQCLKMIGFYSVDVTIDDDGAPFLIEINGSNSGFDGFFIAHQDTSILDAVVSGVEEIAGQGAIYVVTRLVNFGELPRGYLDKLVRDRLYSRCIQNVHETLSSGVIGRTWARFRADRPPSSRGAGSSIDALVQRSPRFKQVFLNVADPTYVLPAEYFNDQPQAGIISLKKGMPPKVAAIPLTDQDVLWSRCSTLAFSAPISTGILMNPEFPYDAVADNKLFTYEVLSPSVPKNIPLSLPVGNRCSGSKALAELLERSSCDYFIRKPLLSSQARGIEILSARDVRDYWLRIAKLEEAESGGLDELPLELSGVPDLLAAWALGFDISLLSELKPSKRVYCRPTGRDHFGCIRSLALVKEDLDGAKRVRFLGAYWRLAPIPTDGDGLLWERYVASQTQGAFCERVSSEDLNTVQRFAEEILTEYLSQLARMPANREGYQKWEESYWLGRYREQVPFLKNEDTWKNFVDRIETAKNNASQLKQEAERAGFRRRPSVSLTEDELRRSNLPYLVEEPQRIVTP